MKGWLLKVILPWTITIVALYLAFRSINIEDLISHLKGAKLSWLAAAFILTSLSYIFRARRWEFFFAKNAMTLFQAWKVLIVGFFMNNVLPARTGELVRAHLGSRTSGLTRTLVLASVASERIADGVTLSLLFVVGALALSHGTIPIELSYVAYLFGAVTIGIGLLLFYRNTLYSLIDRINSRLNHKAASYTASRVRIFVDGLSPLYDPKRIPIVALWSVFIWLIELCAFISVGQAFSVSMPLSSFLIFLVTVNFSSLIPAAPGGIGVIEAVTSAVLVSVGMDRELALAMVLSQHLIQYLVVGIPGALIMLSWKGDLKPVSETAN